MARNTEKDPYHKPLRRLFVAVMVSALAALIVLWRLDTPRAERLRAAIVDRTIPNVAWVMQPLGDLARIVGNVQSYVTVHEQNQQLRRELRTMRAWREAAIQLEQENARLLDLNKVTLNPRLVSITGVVMADSGSPFHHSVILNIGARDTIEDGWATTDGLGLVGRISGLGENTSRVILVTDTSSRIPVVIKPSGRRAIMAGDTTQAPALDFLEGATDIRPGDRVVTSGDGGVFAPDILVGQVAIDQDRRWRVRLAADIGRLEFLKVLRTPGHETIAEPGGLVGTRAMAGNVLQQAQGAGGHSSSAANPPVAIGQTR